MSSLLLLGYSQTSYSALHHRPHFWQNMEKFYCSTQGNLLITKFKSSSYIYWISNICQFLTQFPDQGVNFTAEGQQPYIKIRLIMRKTSWPDFLHRYVNTCNGYQALSRCSRALVPKPDCSPQKLEKNTNTWVPVPETDLMRDSTWASVF